ncbi:MAG: reverse transcriptase domain-containing protein [Saprospiraceae bacterium]
MLALRAELRQQTYQPGPYRTFFIYDPKKRCISAAPFRDRVVHHALCQIIHPELEKRLIADTYANRTGKGTHKAIRRCQYFLRRHDYVLKADIQKYFPSIDLEILKSQIARYIKCPRTRWLTDLIIDNSNPQEIVLNYYAGDHLFTPVERRKGLPMGNLTSQLFANFYLSGFDHFVKEVLRRPYIRYVDDFLVFGDSRAALEKDLERIKNWLAEHLRLNLHPDKTHIVPCRQGITFLGQRIFRDYRRLRRQNVQRFYKRLRRRLKDFSADELPPEKLEAQLNSWMGHARQADTWRLRNNIRRQLIFQHRLLVLETPKGAWRVLERPQKKAGGQPESDPPAF